MTAEVRKTIAKHFAHERTQFEAIRAKELGLEEGEQIPAYQHQAFPKHKYTADGSSVVVASPEAEAALGKGYYDSPADIPAKK